jgi:hypothetical protein
MMKTERCHIEVRVKGMNFPRYHQCKRAAVAKDEHGLPVCKQHSPEARAARLAKADAIRRRRLNLHLAYLRSKNPPTPPKAKPNTSMNYTIDQLEQIKTKEQAIHEAVAASRNAANDALKLMQELNAMKQKFEIEALRADKGNSTE